MAAPVLFHAVQMNSVNFPLGAVADRDQPTAPRELMPVWIFTHDLQEGHEGWGFNGRR